MNTNYRVIKTEEDLRKAVELLSTHQVIGLDTETTELDPYYGRLRLIQLATPSGVHVIDLGGFFDTLLASQLLGAGDIEERHGLEAVASRYLSEAVDKTERLSNWNLELSESQLEYPLAMPQCCCRCEK